ncbi:MAG: amino acid permease, partial [Candidatus Sumerlaeaceae bacterium]|nr:amino acid permease [Candidatus Sumerlaeaceae bacterium]
YYIGGIAEHAIGKAAPWFILMVMLFSACVRAVYVESCSMFVRGGVYRIVREAMGHFMAKIAVSALVFDFVLTGPISSVSAGHYLRGLIEFAAQHFGIHWNIPSHLFACGFAIAVTLYFWWLNVKGIEESSDKALKIMIVTAIMVVILIGWSLITMGRRPVELPPLKPVLEDHALGWLRDIPWIRTMGLAVFLVAFGHSLLAMSGEETLAQVYREIEAPKHKNLVRAATVIFVFSLTFTGFTAFAAVMLVPDEIRKTAGDNLLNELVKHLAGPTSLKLIMTAFVVGVGAMILSGAVNTSLIGSNGVLNRVAEDGILDDWFRQPHRRYGTTYRILNLIMALQIIVIVASRGDVTVLGEAYAFGVVWSFTFMAVSMLILRFKYKGERTWRVPINPKIGKVEVPLGLGAVTLVLVSVAITNLLTKQVATISGIAFTAGFFAVFTISEILTARRRRAAGIEHEHKEKFALERKSEISADIIELEEGKPRVLVPARDPNNLVHLRVALEESTVRETEVIVITVKVEKGEQSFEHVFTRDEELLFTKVVELAEKYGVGVKPLVVPSNNSWFAIARTGYELQVNEILMGKSERVPPDVQLEQMAMMWAMVAENKPIRFRIVLGPEQENEIVAEL